MSFTPNPVTCQQPGNQTDVRCVSVMQDYCSNDLDTSGHSTPQSKYLLKWQGDTVSSPCQQWAHANLISNPCHADHYGPVVDAYVRRYFLTEGHPITYKQQGSTIYDINMQYILSVCQTFPGGCDSVLPQVCGGFIRANLESNPNEAALCGCFMDSAQYTALGGAFGIPVICDPLCVLSSAVKPQLTTSPCTTQTCNKSICVIDNITISLLNNSTAGNINFAQLCSSCAGNNGGGGCQCNISDISITTVESSVKNINFGQNCGGPVNCFKTDSTGTPKQVDCATLESTSGSGSTNSNTSSSNSKGNNTLLIILIVIVLIIIAIIWITWMSGRKRGNDPSLYAYSGYRDNGPPPPDRYTRNSNNINLLYA